MSNNRQSSMEKEFVPYEQALTLKEIGFDEPCFGRFYIKPKCKVFSVDEKGRHYQIKNTPKKLYTIGEYFVLNDDNAITAPTFSQAFRWFRERYNLKGYIMPIEYLDGTQETYQWNIFNECHSGVEQLTYEEAELACLKKLIEIVKDKQQ